MSLWGGRFEEGPAELLWRFTVDRSDRRLLVDDIEGSVAHAAMLADVGILSAEEATAIADGLAAVLEEARSGEFEWSDGDEDVHSAVERRLGELIGPLAGKLHTGRSRNDQICLDLRLYLRRAADARAVQVVDLVRVLMHLAEEVGDTVVASYTHVQQAQAVPLAHHLLAYAWMLVRDRDRFQDACSRIDMSPLGAGASAGSRLPLDPANSAERLGFSSVFANSMDAVASRDFVAEYAFCCAQTMVTLSRLSEELVLWASEEYSWATFDDAFTTGSSAMPQKKNPDIAELARGKTATVIGDLTGLMTLQKGLPLTYNRDLQEDKRAVFHADDTVSLALAALGGMIESAVFHPPQPSSMVTALDLAEILVNRGVPFRQAHEVVGGLVAGLVAEGRTLSDTTAAELEAAHSQLSADDLASLTPAASVADRVTAGGGSMESVQTQLAALRELFG
ncbi:MAG: argininosuccinate lyase [Acidimicrobiia bacterium]|nr:argininosuccinate lyase [Acidimicrobiia bacterium]MDX2468689.1 argininosuccinate lyase [Acidimicrobiia bacterium]